MAKKNAGYSVTPKGLAWLAIRDSGVNITANSPEFHAFWDMFNALLTRYGYTISTKTTTTAEDMKE